MDSTLSRLQSWFRSQCDGEWEHDCGIELSTLDNPGWRLQVNLANTSLQNFSFAAHQDRDDDATEWLRAWRDATTFHAACGPTRLEDAIRLFLDWAQQAGTSKVS